MYNYIGQYLDDYETLLPDDSSVPDLVNTLWYQYIKGKFNDKVWEDFYSRQIFNVMKFNNEDNDINYANIIKSIKIRLQTKSRLYERMFNAFMSDYNPLWNVDGVTGTIRESTHTGTDTDAKTGTENTALSDTGTVTNTGKTDTTNSGKSSNTRTGNETTVPTGKEITENMSTTFDSTTYRDTTKTENSFDTRTDTHTYNSVKDEYSVDTQHPLKESYEIDEDNPLKETRNLNGSNNTTFNTQLQKTLNLKDNDLEMVIRQGNIGVTKSSELLLDTLDLYNNELMDFVHYVVNDCINQISYSIY